ncbi:hypothetical protein GCM10010381_05330 [Streptomyces xantholiticus]|nr:hypothetical protein GCM10010381_05330 [Streptomyces xantholiticus]
MPPAVRPVPHFEDRLLTTRSPRSLFGVRACILKGRQRVVVVRDLAEQRLGPYQPQFGLTGTRVP